MHRIFIKIYYLFRKNRIPGFALLFLFLALCGFLASKITLEEDVSRLIPEGEKQEITRKILDQNEFSDKIIISISSTGEETNRHRLSLFARSFLDSVKKELPQYIDRIQGHVAEDNMLDVYDFVYQNLPLFLNASDYEAIEARLDRDSIAERLRDNYVNLVSPTGLVTKEFIFKDPLSITTLGLSKLRELQVGGDFYLYNDFLLTKDDRHLLLFVDPKYPASETDKNAEFVQKLDRIMASLEATYPETRGEYFGGVLYSLANAKQIKNDIKYTISIALAILLVVLIVFYRKLYVPLILFVPGLAGGLFALAILFLVKPAISAIALGIGAVLVGVSLDYALHILTHFRNNRDVEQLYREVTKPVLMSSITTATAFLCLIFLKSPALQDLGLFAAISLVAASLFALVLIPQLYQAPQNISLEKPGFLDRISAYRFYKFRPVVIVMLALLLISLFFFNRVEFNSDITALNFQPEKLRETEERVTGIAGRNQKNLQLVAYGNDIDEALLRNSQLYENLRELRKNELIENYSSIGGVVLSTDLQRERINRWKRYWNDSKKDRLENDLIDISGNFGFKPESFQYFYAQLDKNFEGIYLEDYQNNSGLYLSDFISQSPGFATVISQVQLGEERASEIYKLFEEQEGVTILDRVKINENFLGDLKQDFNRLIFYSLIAVFVILLLFYRNLELAVLSLLPVAGSWVIALGIMAMTGLEFNILNIIISTFIFGLGLDYSIFMTNAFLREYDVNKEALPTYQASILLSVLTTLLGMGALVFAKHPALQSVAVVSVIGIIAAVSVVFILQAWLLNFLFIERRNSGKPAFKFANLFTATNYENDQLFYREAVFDNLRYKPRFRKFAGTFNAEKERYLKTSTFLEENDRVLLFGCANNILPLYLSYKKPGLELRNYIEDEMAYNRAKNSFRSLNYNLEIINEIPENLGRKEVFIICGKPSAAGFEFLKQAVNLNAKKVIILDSQFSYRWIIDLDFEIQYRQNNIVVLSRLL
ncbi:MMPL family transporter [Salegentibacter sp. HM20]